MPGRGCKKAPKRHRKVRRNNIQGITKLAIRRLARRGGVKRLTDLMYEEIRGVFKASLQPIIEATVCYTEHARRRTVTRQNLIHGLALCGKKLYM